MIPLLLLAAVSIFAAWAFSYAQSKDQARYVRVLHDEHNREREQWQRERGELLNRIKPETAQYIPPPGPVERPKAIGMDQDDEYWEKVAGMSTEDLARAMTQQELAGLTE